MIDFFIYGDDIDDLMQKYEINTPLRIAHFLAQIDHESSGLMRMTEMYIPTMDGNIVAEGH